MGQKNRQGKEEGRNDRTPNKKLNLWITNADVLTQEKIMELKARMKDSPPDVIAISEVKPKNLKHQSELVHYALDGYEMDFVNLINETGRGMIVYISKKLDFNIVELHLFFHCLTMILCVF